MNRALVSSSILISLLASTPAFATRARLRALNQDGNGSYYLVDTRNIYLNPAQITLLKDNATFEWGKRDRPGTYSPSTEGEGGAVTTLGAGKLAINFGRVTEFSQDIRAVNAVLPDAVANTVGSNYVEGQNALDLVYGGGTEAMRWGVGASVTRSKMATGTPDKRTYTQALELRGGVYNAQFEGFAGLLLNGQTLTPVGNTQGEFKENVGVKVGGGFNLAPDKKIYGSLRYATLDMRLDSGAANYSGRMIDFLAGFSGNRTAVAGARVFYAVELAWNDWLAKDQKPANNNEKVSMLALPVTIGVEADATSWLRLRGSVKQGFLLGNSHDTSGGSTHDNNRYENAPNDTSVAGGAGASLNNFNFDVALVQSMSDDHGRVEGAMTYIF